jgi:autophagy-related protein 13
MIIESYIDASSISSSQSLVVVDDNGKRWDVLEALNAEDYDDADDLNATRGRRSPRNREVILERWRLELKCLPNVAREEFGPSLPTVYKRAIVFFRSLFVSTRIMPCWKYSQQALAKGMHPALEVKCRVLHAEPEYLPYDPLRVPLVEGHDAVTEYVFTDLEVPVGRFYASVTYRNDCNFRVDDAESLLSSRFMGIDEHYFRPTVPPRVRHERVRSDLYGIEPGSLPSSQRHDRGPLGPQQTYGSLSTFHGEGALATSPITALRSVRPIGSDTSSPSASPSPSVQEPEPPHSLPIRGAAARAAASGARRPSLSFQPFKAGSLSGSPRIPPDQDVPPSPQSLTRQAVATAAATGPTRTGNRSSLTMGSAASLRGAPVSAPQDIPTTVSGSPRPGSRYSSSFSHRRSRPSFGGQSGQSRGEDDQASSGKQSLSSSAQPGSGLLTEVGGVGSSGSFAADDDNISDFLKALESRKTLKSFEVNKKGESLASKKTAAQLSRFQMMRESNNALTDSMTSSIHLQRSSSSSSRQLPNVPGMVNPSPSISSSSPGKAISPHTPHTPAIPSRLSENSIIDYAAQRGRNDTGTSAEDQSPALEEDEDDDETPMVTQQDAGSANETGSGTAGTTTTGATAIDIPLSPRLHLHAGGHETRRSASVAHRQHRSAVSSELGGDVQRPASTEGVGAAAAAGREGPPISALRAYQQQMREAATAPAAQVARAAGLAGGTTSSAGAISTSAAVPASSDSVSSSPAGGAPVSSSAASASGSGVPSTPAPGAVAAGVAAVRAGAGSRASGRPGSFSSARYGASLEGGDDEPLLFAMSELERRSLEEGRAPGASAAGGGSGGAATASGSGSAQSGRCEPPRGVSRRGW